MWIPKSTTEVIADTKARTRRRVSLAVAASAGIGYCVARCSVWQALPAGGLAEPLRWIAAGTAASAVLAASYCWCHSARHKCSTMVCPQCNRVKTADAEPRCPCGGKFLCLHEVKWAEVPPKPCNPSPNPPETRRVAATTDSNAELLRQHSRNGGLLITSIRKFDSTPPKPDPDREGGATGKR